MRIELGCLSRPWGNFTLEQALEGIAAAGFKTCGPLRHQGSPAISADSTEEDISRLKSALQRHALRAQVTISGFDLSADPQQELARFQREIEHVQRVGMEYIILGGTDDVSKYESWYSLVQDSLDYARDHGMTILLKPHGGLSALGQDLRRAAARLAHPNFAICYDPGNIYYYTGLSAEEDLPQVADLVRAMCIKDERGGKHGEVMITPGTGVVDFRRIFSLLAEAGFSGPCWVECVGGHTLEEINAEAVKTYRFITEIVARIY